MAVQSLQPEYRYVANRYSPGRLYSCLGLVGAELRIP